MELLKIGLISIYLLYLYYRIGVFIKKIISKYKAQYFFTEKEKMYLESKELNKEEKQVMLGMLGNLEDNEIKQLIFEVLDPIGYNMMVTPKEIDFVLNKLTITISRAINISLHENYK